MYLTIFQGFFLLMLNLPQITQQVIEEENHVKNAKSTVTEVEFYLYSEYVQDCSLICPV